MKRIYLLRIVLALAVVLQLAACKKDDPEVELPPATHEGNNIGGCLIDGEVWKTSPTSGLFGSSTGLFALVNKKTGQSTYVINIGLASDDPSRGINFQCLNATGVGIYPFTLKVPAHASEPDYASYRNSSGNGPRGEFLTGPTATGQLEIRLVPQ